MLISCPSLQASGGRYQRKVSIFKTNSAALIRCNGLKRLEYSSLLDLSQSGVIVHQNCSIAIGIDINGVFAEVITCMASSSADLDLGAAASRGADLDLHTLGFTIAFGAAGVEHADDHGSRAG